MKSLYASPVGKDGVRFLKNNVEKFGHDKFDFLIFDYENANFNDITGIKIIKSKGYKWAHAVKFLIPKLIDKYEYLFWWDDDIDILNFNINNYLNIIRRNKLSVSQPALDQSSQYSHAICLYNPSTKYGRFTTFVEIMIPVYTAKAWKRLYKYLELWNPWGWGYDSLLWPEMGIIDTEIVKHTRNIKSHETTAAQDVKKWEKKHNIRSSPLLNLDELK